VNSFPRAAELVRATPGSDEAVAGLVARRALARELFGPYPALARSLAATEDAALDRVLDAADAGGWSLDWRLHLDVGLAFDIRGREAWHELGVAAVRRWSRTAPAGVAWIALWSAALPDRVVVACRARALDAGPRVLGGRLRGPVPTGTLAYQVGERAPIRPTSAWTPYPPAPPSP
jgi:hypothetical protein